MKATQYIVEQLVHEFPCLGDFTSKHGERYVDLLTPDEPIKIALMGEEKAAYTLTDRYQDWDGTGWYERACAALSDGSVVKLASGEKSETLGVQLRSVEEQSSIAVEYAVVYGWERQYGDSDVEQTLTIYKVKGDFDLSAWARRQRQRALAELEAAMHVANESAA